MAKLDVKVYQQKIDFLEKELYPKRDELNVLLYELGESDTLHSLAFDQVFLENEEEDIRAWKVYVLGHFGAEMSMISRIRVIESELNELLKNAAKLGIIVIIGDPVQIMLDPELAPDNSDEMYTGRLAWQLVMYTPNLDESVTQASPEVPSEEQKESE